jgi:coenzyme F420-0:L-glutamate ligase/coenzyme F420-1:gamma-L-glutamate ligase
LPVPELRVIPVEGIPEVVEGDDLAALIAERVSLEDRDVVVISQKVVSKAEGRVVRLDGVEPSERAHELAAGEDARRLEVILSEAAEIVRTRPPLVIAETRHGFVCASAGVDASNAPEDGTLVLLPVDPDASAARIRSGLTEHTGRQLGVVISDSFGRPFRNGIVDVALGCAGIAPLLDLRGVTDPVGHVLQTTIVAVADEIASAAELVMGKLAGIPVAVVRGLDVAGDGRARDLVMDRERDLFR